MSNVNSGPVEVDIESRERQVLGDGQRIQPIPPEGLTEATKELSGMIRQVFGVTDNSVIPDMFATMAKTPGLYKVHLELGMELVRNGKIPARERELVILRVGWLCRAPFEWGEHVDYGKRCGLTDKEVERVTQGSDAPGWGEHDRAVLRATEELVGDHFIADDTWAILAKSWSEEQLIEMPVLVGHYFLTGLLYNTMRFQLLPGNPGLKHR